MLEPDSTALSVVVWLLAAAIMVGVAVFGHRMGGRSVRHAAGRLAGTLGAALTVGLAAVLTMNGQYGWYTSWSDVGSSFTGQKIQGEQKVYGGARTPQQKAQAEHKADSQNAVSDSTYSAQRSAFQRQLGITSVGPEGRWVKITVPGLGVKGRDIGRVMVWLPPSYTSSPQRSYPVIEAFHGIPGGTLDYERVFHLDKALLTAHQKGKVGEAIIVVPQEMPNGLDTECVDAPGLKMQTWLTHTVPDFVISHLRAQSSRESWTTLGVSAGGWCASMAGLLTPDRYAGVVSLGGYFTPQFSNFTPFAQGGVPEQYDLVKRAKEHPTDQALWVLVSGADKTSGASSEAFTKAVRAPDALTTVDYPHAGHRVSVWERALPDVFAWMGQTLPEFAANAPQVTSSPSASDSSPATTHTTHTTPGVTGRHRLHHLLR